MKVLLDEMFSPAIAEQLRHAGKDVIAVKETDALIGLQDPDLFAWCRDNERAIVTYNLDDFMELVKEYGASGEGHTGLIAVSSKTFPQHPGSHGALVNALDSFIDSGQTWPSFVHWLQ